MDEQLPTSVLQEGELSHVTHEHSNAQMNFTTTPPTAATNIFSYASATATTEPSQTVAKVSNVSASSPMEYSATPNQSSSQNVDASANAASIADQPLAADITEMETEKHHEVPATIPTRSKSVVEDVSLAVQQPTTMTETIVLPHKEDKIEMIMPKTPSEGSIKSISPSSNSSGSRSRKSSLSSKSPKAHSPGNVASPGSQGRPRKTRPPPPIKDDIQVNAIKKL